MPVVFPGIAQSALIVGRTPRSAADAPVGLLALCMMLTQLFQPRSFGKNEWHWVVNLRRIGNPPAALGRASVTFPESPASFRLAAVRGSLPSCTRPGGYPGNRRSRRACQPAGPRGYPFHPA